MAGLLAFVHALSLFSWVGGLLFLFLVAVPAAGQVLADDLARAVTRQLLRGYHALGVACGLVALVSLAALATLPEGVGRVGPRLGLLVIMLGLTLADAAMLQPRIERDLAAWRAVDPGTGRQQLARLHRLERLALQTHATVLLCGLINLWLWMGGSH